jgi:uncharacterized protein
MPRPKKYRCIKCKTDANYFKPRGIPHINLEEISLSADKMEASVLPTIKGFAMKKQR